LKIALTGSQKPVPKTHLDILFHPAKIQSVLLPQSQILGIYPSGGFYEKGSPEVANSKEFGSFYYYSERP
jgi:hypothetical protein